MSMPSDAAGDPTIRGSVMIQYNGGSAGPDAELICEKGIQYEVEVISDEYFAKVYFRAQPLPVSTDAIVVATDVSIGLQNPLTDDVISSQSAKAVKRTAADTFSSCCATFAKSQCDAVTQAAHPLPVYFLIKYQVRLVPVKFGDPAEKHGIEGEAAIPEEATRMKMKWVSLQTYLRYQNTNTIVISEEDVSDLIKDAHEHKCFELLAAVRTLVSTADPITLFAIRKAAAEIGEQGLCQVADTAIDKFLEPKSFCTLSLTGAKDFLSNLDPETSSKKGFRLLALCFKWADAEVKHMKKKKTEKLMKDLMRPLLQFVHISQPGRELIDDDDRSDLFDLMMAGTLNKQDVRNNDAGSASSSSGSGTRDSDAETPSPAKKPRGRPRKYPRT
jgi:hypothetical protein